MVDHFPAIPPHIRRELESIITRAIKRAITEQMGRLELEAEREADKARGKGKQGKGYDPAALYFHTHWQRRFKSLRTGKEIPEDLEAGGWYQIWKNTHRY